MSWLDHASTQRDPEKDVSPHEWLTVGFLLAIKTLKKHEYLILSTTVNADLTHCGMEELETTVILSSTVTSVKKLKR